MRIEGERESGNVEDRRGIGGGGLAVGGGVGTVILALVVWFMGGDPRQVVNQSQAPQQQGAPAGQGGAPVNDEASRFLRVVLGSTEDVWRDQFRKQLKREYQAPTLVIFSDRVSSACGMATSATGPFYCPGDQKLYLDTVFFGELARRFKAPGDFAQAYVVAHEVGHHIQKLRGITDKVDAARRTLSKEEYNKVSVRLELQADFLAGVWAHHAQKTRKVLEPGDLEEGLRAASAVGDDSIQKAARGHVVPESFTHGSARQRAAWFRKGFETGDLSQGNTFEMPDP